LPGISLYAVQEVDRLANGNTVINNWPGGLPLEQWPSQRNCASDGGVRPRRCPARAGKSIAGAFDKLGKTLKEGQPESSAARARTARPAGATWSTPEKNVARETVTRETMAAPATKMRLASSQGYEELIRRFDHRPC
jgi:hypothetical protein